MIWRWVPRLRSLVKFISLTMVISGAGFLYREATTPYRVRYYRAPTCLDGWSQQLNLYSEDGTTNPVFISVSCKPTKLTDIRFRPTLEAAREWSLREMIPSTLAGTGPFAKNSPEPIEKVADRHLSGGLADWENLEEANLRSRVHELLAEKQWRLSVPDRTAIEDAFLLLPNRHETTTLPFPAKMKPQDLFLLRGALDRIQQGWERDVNAVGTDLLVRWQSLTGATMLAPLVGIGGGTPVFLSLPPLKSKSGAVVTVTEEPTFGTPVIFDVSAGNEEVYQAPTPDELKMAGYSLAFFNHPRTFVLGSLALMLLLWVAYHLWRWPKQLDEVRLFLDAQSLDHEDLWQELRKRHAWADRYITEQFLIARSGVPTQEVLGAFWRVVRETFKAKPVTPTNELQVKQAIFDVLDQVLLDALR